MEKQAPALSAASTMTGWWWMAFQYLLLPELLGFLTGGMAPALENFLYHLLCFTAAVVIFRRYLGSCLRWTVRFWKQGLFVCLVSLAAYYASAFLIQQLLAALDPGFFNRNDAQILWMLEDSLPLVAVTTILLAPLSEELLFRGLLFGAIRNRSRWGAYGISCLCFGLIHTLGYLGTISLGQFFLTLVQYLPAGLILCWSLDKSRSIAVPVCIHMAINAISLLAAAGSAR